VGAAGFYYSLGNLNPIFLVTGYYFHCSKIVKPILNFLILLDERLQTAFKEQIAHLSDNGPHRIIKGDYFF